MKVTFDITRNYESLHYGDGYAVLYFDVERQEASLRAGIWRGPEFDFPTFKTKQPPKMKPKMNDESGVALENYVLGWYRLKDWREPINVDFTAAFSDKYFMCAPI